MSFLMYPIFLEVLTAVTDETLLAHHSVEEEFLWCKTADKTVLNKSFAFWTDIILGEVGQGSVIKSVGYAYHQRSAVPNRQPHWAMLIDLPLEPKPYYSYGFHETFQSNLTNLRYSLVPEFY